MGSLTPARAGHKKSWLFGEMDVTGQTVSADAPTL
jgi:hypothetical protein